MFKFSKKAESNVSPFFFSAIFILLLIVMSLFITLFNGEVVQFIESVSSDDGITEEEEISQDPCSDLSLSVNKICRGSDLLNIEVRNSGTVSIDKILFQIIESGDKFNLTQVTNNVRLNSGQIKNYSVDYSNIDDITSILLIPYTNLDEKLTVCSAVVKNIDNIEPCSRSNLHRGGGSGSGGSNIVCTDQDGDGYGSNCAFGNDCNDADSFVWQLVNTYADDDLDDYGIEDEFAQTCLGDLNSSVTLNALRSLRRSLVNGDCDDTDPTINPGEIEDCRDAIDDNCDSLLCVDCLVENPVPATGCICSVTTYYDGYCCNNGWSLVNCDNNPDNPPGLSPNSIISVIIKFLFYH